MRNYLIIISIVLLGYNSNAQQRRQREVQPFKNFDVASRFISDQAEKGLFSGTVLVIQNNEVVIKEAYGLANQESNKPMRIDTKINVGSIGKSFTKVAVAQLIEQGKINIDDKIIDYIPELKMDMANEITIEHLLQMKSGLASYWENETFLNNLQNLRDMEDYLPIIANQELSFKPGSNRQYSNSGFELLGILIQRVSGEKYYDYMKENVFKKANMKNTDAFERDKKTKNLAMGYSQYREDEQFGLTQLPEERQGNFVYNVNSRLSVKGTAAGGTFSTLDDLHNYIISLSNNELINEKYTDLIFNRFQQRKDRNPSYRVAGGAPGINAMISADLENNNFIIVLANYDPPVASQIASRLAATLN